MRELCLGAVALALTQAACSLLVPLDSCSVDADCAAGEACTADALCIRLCVDPEPPKKADGVVLGAIQTLSGPTDTATNRAHRHAIRVAVEALNGSRALGDRTVSLVQCDTGGDSARAGRAASFLVEHHGAVAILGLEFSSTVEELAEYSTQRQVVLMSHWATSENLKTLQLRQDEPSLIWRTVSDDSHHVDALVGLVEATEVERLAVAVVDDEWGTGLVARFGTEFCAARGAGCLDAHEYKLADPYEDIGASDRSTWDLVAKLAARQERYQALLLAAYKEHTMALADAMESEGYRIPLVAIEDALDPAALRHASVRRLVDGGTAVLGVTPGMSQGRCYGEFALRYKADPDAPRGAIAPFAAHAYDSMVLLGLAVGAVGDEAVTGPELALALARLSAEAGEEYGAGRLHEAVQALRNGDDIDYVGASGDLRFDARYGDPAASSLDHLLVELDPNTGDGALCHAIDVGLFAETPETPKCREGGDAPAAPDGGGDDPARDPCTSG